MNKLLITATILLISCLSSNAQDTLTGNLPSWDKGQADISMFIGFMVEPLVVGSIEESGRFSIPLTDDILEKTKKAMEEYNSGSSDGRLSLSTLERAFQCYDEDAITVTNGDQQAITLATMGTIQIADLDQKMRYGDFMAANSEAFANYFTSLGELDAVKGFYLNWYYVEEPASVEGQCAVETYALNQKESYKEIKAYDLNFKKGWNIVINSLEETYTDSDGKTYPMKWTFSTIDEMPEDTQFISWIEEH